MDERTDSRGKRVDSCDVVVVGAGVVGAAVAARLSLEGRESAVLEARRVAGGATGRCGGTVLAGLPGHYSRAVAAYGREIAREVWALTAEGRQRLIASAHSLNVPVAATGSLSVAGDEAEARVLEASAGLLREDGFDAAFARGDPFERGFVASLHHRRDGTVDATELTRALLSSAGAIVHEQTEVVGFESEGSRVRVWAHGRTVLCDDVVLAVDGYSPLLDGYFADKISPRRGLLLATEPLSNVILTQPCSAGGGTITCRQTPDWRLLLGNWARPSAAAGANGTDDALRAQSQEFAARHFPELSGEALARVSAVGGFTPDGLPLVGTLPEWPHIHFAVGLGARGLSWAFVVADRVIDLMMHGVEPGLLSAGRLPATVEVPLGEPATLAVPFPTTEVGSQPEDLGELAPLGTYTGPEGALRDLDDLALLESDSWSDLGTPGFYPPGVSIAPEVETDVLDELALLETEVDAEREALGFDRLEDPAVDVGAEALLSRLEGSDSVQPSPSPGGEVPAFLAQRREVGLGEEAVVDDDEAAPGTVLAPEETRAVEELARLGAELELGESADLEAAGESTAHLVPEEGMAGLTAQEGEGGPDAERPEEDDGRSLEPAIEDDLGPDRTGVLEELGRLGTDPELDEIRDLEELTRLASDLLAEDEAELLVSAGEDTGPAADVLALSDLGLLGTGFAPEGTGPLLGADEEPGEIQDLEDLALLDTDAPREAKTLELAIPRAPVRVGEEEAQGLDVLAPREAPVRDTVIRTTDLTKRFKRLTAVDAVSFSVRKGEVFGFLGPNGAGKTTTIAMLLGLVRPTSGTAEVLGHDIRRDSSGALRAVGAIVETPAFYPYLSGIDNLRLFARILGRNAELGIPSLLEQVGMATRGKDKVGTYSSGMRQRLGLAAAMLGDPELLILDEPTNGLDPAGMQEIRLLIRELAEEEGKSVFLSSHLLHEVEQVCDRVLILNRGKVIAQGEVTELLGEANAVEMRIDRPRDAARLLSGLKWVGGASIVGDHLRVQVSPGRTSDVLAALAGAQLYPTEVRPVAANLESVFLELTGANTGATDG
jgi:ABC-2 type transport system ATP-binding protein